MLMERLLIIDTYKMGSGDNIPSGGWGHSLHSNTVSPHYKSIGDTAKKKYPLRGCYFRMGTSIAGAQAPEFLNAGGGSMAVGIDEGSVVGQETFENV